MVSPTVTSDEDRAEIQAALRKMSAAMLTKVFGSVASGSGVKMTGLTGLLGATAHPASPFPYGTIIKPSAQNPWPDETRLMMIGPSPSDPGFASVSIRLNGLGEDWPPEFHVMTNDWLNENWEEDS